MKFALRRTTALGIFRVTGVFDPAAVNESVPPGFSEGREGNAVLYMNMKSSLPRRDFLKYCGQIGAICTCCGLVNRISAAGVTSAPPATPKLPDLKDRAYCGLICDDSCPLFKATRTDDPAAKKVVFEKWKWKETFGIEFDPDRVFCHGCKAPGKPENLAHGRCTVLKCCVGRKLESCLQCGKLAGCDKELWKNWPDFKKQIDRLQQDYIAAGRFELS